MPFRRDTGSSPLARGLQSPVAHGHPHDWIIPARAGFTDGLTIEVDPTTDHPRSRGVYSASWLKFSVVSGSSPLARGLRRRVGRRRGICRIIPARAGFTRPSWTSPRTPGDHPRSRGVYACVIFVPSESPGSSPLARGLRGGRPGGQ